MPEADVATWDEFSERLFRVLLTIDDRVYLNIGTKPPHDRRYVQFASSAEELVGEATGNEFLSDEYKLGAEAETQMRELGWETPLPSNPNWHFAIALPASSADIKAIVDHSVTTLRDMMKILSPTDLMYRAWREAEWPVSGVYYEEEDLDELDPGEDPLELDLGIEMTC